MSCSTLCTSPGSAPGCPAIRRGAGVGVLIKNAIRAIADDDSEFLEVKNVLAANAVLDELKTAFAAVKVAFEVATSVGDHYLSVECQFNDDESGGHGPYIRVLHTVILSPAAKNLGAKLKKLDLKVFKSEKDWKAERKVSGV